MAVNRRRERHTQQRGEESWLCPLYRADANRPRAGARVRLVPKDLPNFELASAHCEVVVVASECEGTQRSLSDGTRNMAGAQR
eukprot:SAG31_NODE_5722_length_2359_cov_81.762832_3_plen_83_part_00